MPIKGKYFLYQQIDKEWQNPDEWTRKSIYNGLRTGKFSSDRSIKEYADQIWKLTPCKVAEEGDYNGLKCEGSKGSF